mmetsp:Transcript_74608/g.222536  ORF Transcript_74608/g.222536 Transcript_74608/m.222536 type:complete len:254 (+) Transcript_74608:2262-3023(+)
MLVGSSENAGSAPSRIRHCSAMDRYSKFTDPAGSRVSETLTVASSSCSARIKQHRPCIGCRHPSVFMWLSLRGIRSARQPMSCFARASAFCALSLSRRASSSSCICCSMSLAMHSPCRSPSPSLSTYTKLPSGRRHWRQRVTTSSSESSTSSKSLSTACCRRRREASPAAGESRARSSRAEASGKEPAPARPRPVGWKKSRGVPSRHFTPTATNSRPSGSRTTWPCLKPLNLRHASSRTSNLAKHASLDVPAG